MRFLLYKTYFLSQLITVRNRNNQFNVRISMNKL